MSLGVATPYLRQKIIDHLNGVATYTPPATLLLGFTTVLIPTTISSYAAISANEMTGHGYAATTIANTSSTWNAADASGTAVSKILVTCFTASSTVTVPGIAFYLRQPATDNLLYTGAIDALTPILPTLGQIVTFPPGSLITTLGNS